VLVDGGVVATLTTDGRGEGRLEILNLDFDVTSGSTLQFRDPAGNVLLTATFRPDDDDNGGDDDNSGPGGGDDD
jgi:hypothetical protein